MKTLLLVVAIGLSAVPASAQWTRAVVQPESVVKGDRYYVVLVLDDGAGGNKARRELDIPVVEATAPLIAEKLRVENNIQTAKTSVVAAGQVITIAAPPPVDPPKADKDKSAWLAKRNSYLRKKADVDAGITAEQDEADALLAELNKTYQTGYVD